MSYLSIGYIRTGCQLKISMKIAILLDIHGNLEAMDNCLKDLESNGVDTIMSLGDLVGYGPEPDGVVRLAQALKIKCVMGNHDYAVNAVCAERWFNPQARTVVAMTRKLLSDQSLDFLKTLPNTIETTHALLVHGFPPNSFKTYIYMVPEKGIKRVLAAIDKRIVFVGHTHELYLYELLENNDLSIRPLKKETFTLNSETKYIINAGSVGQPRDGDPRAKYLLWDTSNCSIEVRYIEYNVEKVANKIIERGFPEIYAKRLFGRIC